jgi:redox-sensing transcriptional repressor
MDKTNHHISEIVVRRLSDYLRCIRIAEKKGTKILTSRDISQRCGLNSSIVRKDLAMFGAYGVRGSGYRVSELIARLNGILGLDKIRRVVLIGAGNLGTAILNYPGFAKANFHFVAAFDNHPDKIGTKIADTPVMAANLVNDFIRDEGIQIVVLTVPETAAADVADMLDPAYVKGILNFTPHIFPRLRKGVFIHNIDLTGELELIAYCMKHCLSSEGTGRN